MWGGGLGAGLFSLGGSKTPLGPQLRTASLNQGPVLHSRREWKGERDQAGRDVGALENPSHGPTVR